MHVEHRRTVKVVSDNQYKGKSLNSWMKIQDGGKELAIFKVEKTLLFIFQKKEETSWVIEISDAHYPRTG